MILPYFCDFGAALGYDCFSVSFAMAGGAYLSAKNGAIECASKHLWRSSGVVSWIEGGPRRPEEQTQMSRRPKAFRTSSMSTTVSSSLAMLKG